MELQGRAGSPQQVSGRMRPADGRWVRGESFPKRKVRLRGFWKSIYVGYTLQEFLLTTKARMTDGVASYSIGLKSYSCVSANRYDVSRGQQFEKTDEQVRTGVSLLLGMASI